jgi:hypothetical protein
MGGTTRSFERVGPRTSRSLYAGRLCIISSTKLRTSAGHAILLATAIERRASEPLITADDAARAIADLDKVEAKLSKQMLGKLIQLSQSQSLIAQNDELEANLVQSLKDRNKLVHHFFWDNSLELHSSEGRRRMAEELNRILAQLLRTIKDFAQITKPLQEAVGVTDEGIETLGAAVKAGATEVEVKALLRQFWDRRPLGGQMT